MSRWNLCSFPPHLPPGPIVIHQGKKVSLGSQNSMALIKFYNNAGLRPFIRNNISRVLSSAIHFESHTSLFWRCYVEKVTGLGSKRFSIREELLTIIGERELLTWAHHMVSWMVSYRTWWGKNSLCYWGKCSPESVCHVCLCFPTFPRCNGMRSSFACPIRPCALAEVKTRWRIFGELYERLQRTILWRSELFRCRPTDLHINTYQRNLKIYLWIGIVPRKGMHSRFSSQSCLEVFKWHWARCSRSQQQLTIPLRKAH